MPSQRQVTATRTELLRCLKTKTPRSSAAAVGSVKMHIMTPVLHSQPNRKLGRMSMFHAGNISPTKGMPGTWRQNAAKPGKSPRNCGVIGNGQGSNQGTPHAPKDSPKLARLTIAGKKMQRNAQLTGVTMPPKPEQPSAPVPKVQGENKGRSLVRKSEREARRELTRKALNFITALGQQRKAALRRMGSASPRNLVPDSSPQQRKRLPESTFAIEANASMEIEPARPHPQLHRILSFRRIKY